LLSSPAMLPFSRVKLFISFIFMPQTLTSIRWKGIH
jgi:hypothetical protein